MGLGAQIPSTSEGPHALLSSSEFKDLVATSHHKISHSYLHVKEKPTLEETLSQFNTTLKDEVFFYLQHKILPIVLGGDHSIAVGTWFAVMEHLKQSGKELGLIWIDAHMDAHTFSSSPSGAYHGMPLASLLGYGPSLIQEHPSLCKLLPENLILIATRSYEKEEEIFLKKHGVRIIYMREISQRGFATHLQKAYSFLKSKQLEIGISFDFDAIDPTQAPGVGSKEEKGLCKKDCLAGFSQLNLLEDVVCIELVEYNPKLDIEEKTKQIAIDLLKKLLFSTAELRS